MITSAKNYTKKKNKTDRQNPRTNGKSKAIQTKSHKEAYTYTFTKREKGKYIHIYIQKKKEEREKGESSVLLIVSNAKEGDTIN